MKKTVFRCALCILLSLILAFCTLSMTTSAVSEVTRSTLNVKVDGWEEFPYVPERQWSYSFTKLNIYAEFEAQMIQVPAGYSGYVMEMDGDAAIGIIVDFTDMYIPMSTVKAIHFRLYYPDTTKEVRATDVTSYSWLLRYVAAKPNTWDDVVIDSATSLAKMANADGTLGAFGMGVRFYDGVSNHHVWIDSISVELIPGDTTPPVITYNGPTELNWTAGKPFSLDATAYDKQEKSSMPITYEWESGSLDENGLPTEGDHICKICSADSFGNKSEIKLTVHVGPKDTEAPKISFRAKTIRTFANTYADTLVIPVTDNVDSVTAEYKWSEGALDAAGKLKAGTHTLTVSAKDLSGNETTMVVTVIAE